ncbi:MAG: hypothetical protein ABFD81_03740 [Syntrophaceae bacterium]
MMKAGKLILAVGFILSAVLCGPDTIQTALLAGCGLLCLAGVGRRSRTTGLD